MLYLICKRIFKSKREFKKAEVLNIYSASIILYTLKLKSPNYDHSILRLSKMFLPKTANFIVFVSHC